MRQFVTTLIGLLLFAPLQASAFLGMNAGATLQGPLPAWTRQIGAHTVLEPTSTNAVASDPSGNIIIAGYTKGDLGGNTLTGTRDFFVTKYNPSGTVLWTRQLGVASKNVNGNAVATDSVGNIFVAGDTTGGLDGNTLTGYQDFFVTKYDSTGAKLWTKQLGIATKTTAARGVATDSSGNVFVAGNTDGGLDGNTLTGSIDFFVTKYDSAGVKQWTKQLGKATNFTFGLAVTTDLSGNIFVAGQTSGGLDGNTLTGTTDFFVTKYDSTGAKIWTKQLGAASKSTSGMAVTTDSSGNIFVAGYTYGGLDGNSLTGTSDFFVTKYDSTGAKIWTKQLGAASQYTNAYGVKTDSSGNIFVAGHTNGGLDGNSLTGTQDFFVTKYDSTGAKQWSKQLGVASTSTSGSGVATDSSGNIFVAGSTYGGLDGNTLTGSQDSYVTKYDSTGTKTWTKQLGTLGRVDISTGVAAIDGLGNLYVAGTTDGGLDGNSQSGGKDFFVTKYSSSGTKLWTRQLGTDAWTVAYAVATDPSGNVFVAGLTQDGLDGNTFAGDEDFFVTKYDPSGTKLWTRELGAASGWTEAYAVATDSSGNVFVAGSTAAGLDGNTITGWEDFFVTKYDPSGTKLWTKQLGVASHGVWANAVATDSSGNVYVAGNTDGGLDGNTLIGTEDFFVTKYNSSGTKLWTKQLGVASTWTEAYGLTTDSSGNVFVSGGTSGGLDGNTLSGSNDFFVTKYNSSGTKLWTKQLGVASHSTWANAVAIDSSGNIFVTGSTSGGLDGNTSTGTKDVFVTKYTSAGLRQWTRQMGSVSSITSGNSIAVHPSGRIYIAGTTTGGLDFNSQIGTQDAFACQYIGN
ncbi:MAG: SBBP repeat-containing protein [Bdellovibrionia bacterium]